MLNPRARRWHLYLPSSATGLLFSCDQNPAVYASAFFFEKCLMKSQIERRKYRCIFVFLGQQATDFLLMFIGDASLTRMSVLLIGTWISMTTALGQTHGLFLSIAPTQRNFYALTLGCMQSYCGILTIVINKYIAVVDCHMVSPNESFKPKNTLQTNSPYCFS